MATTAAMDIIVHHPAVLEIECQVTGLTTRIEWGSNPMPESALSDLWFATGGTGCRTLRARQSLTEQVGTLRCPPLRDPLIVVPAPGGLSSGSIPRSG